MPIGKNALKRVTNNGYSKVVTEAPDMENSTHVTEDTAKIIEEKTAEKPVKQERKTPEKKSVAKKAEKSTKAAEGDTSTRPDGFVHVSIGAELPIHLL